MFTKLLWPKQCVPTRVYVIFWVISFIYMLVVFILAKRALTKAKMAEGNIDIDDKGMKMLYGKIVMSGIVGAILILLVNSYLFNMMCGEEGKNNRQIMSAIVGFLIVTPLVSSLVMGITSGLILGKDKKLYDFIMNMKHHDQDKPVPTPTPPTPVPNPPQPTLFY